jgi:hypothetical protein
MTNRILKRHKRQVSRAKARVKVSEPDVRTSEEIRAAREESRPTGGGRSAPLAPHLGPSAKGHSSSVAGSAAKVDG